MRNYVLQHPSFAQGMFLILFFFIFVVLNVLVGFYLVHWRSLISLAQFFILQFINFGVAYGLTEFVLSIIVPKRDLAHVKKLSRQPTVAILYVTCDDVIPEILAQLNNQTYSNYDVYVLDDSSEPKCKAQVDKSDFKIVRRGSREGFKAGNLNNWLSLYGAKYEYFVVVDSDSYLAPDFLEKMLRYAEHPANKDVAIFQSKIGVWNLNNYFAHIIAAWFPLWIYPVEKIGNLCDTVLSWGHNCLYQTSLILSIGGFDERFIAEDYANAVRLLQSGYKCKLVDVVSYEAIPPSPQAYAQRAIRWAKQTIQLFQLDTTGLPITTKLHVLANAWSFAIWIVYIPGMLLVVWGSKSTFQDLTYFVWLLASGKFIHTPLLVPTLIIILYNVYFLLLRYPFCRKLGVSSSEYWGTLTLLLALGPYMALPLAFNQLKTLLFSRSYEFNVTRKSYENTNILEDLLNMWHVFLLIAVVLIGISRNPLSIVFNAPWLVPLIISPIVILLVNKRQTTKGRSGKESVLLLDFHRR